MAIGFVNERSACTVRVRFFASTRLPMAPLSVRYKVTDVTNGRTVTDWTTLTPAAVIDIPIGPDENAILKSSLPSQNHAVTVQTDFDTPNQFTSEERYVVRNLRGGN
jgi:hypothetical protein